MEKKYGNPNKVNFIQQNPREFSLLNCLRKALFTTSNFELTLNSQFSMNEKEYDIWGKYAEEFELIDIENASRGRRRCTIKPNVIQEILRSLGKIKLGKN